VGKHEDVDALAEEVDAATKALVKKPVQDGGNTSTAGNTSSGDNTTNKEPNNTSDNSNVVVAIVALVASVIGLAVLVIGKKRRA
jgi:LPXTG-motif cell wall-anchored protein